MKACFEEWVWERKGKWERGCRREGSKGGAGREGALGGVLIGHRERCP